MPAFVQVRETRWRGRTTQRWNEQGPSAYERWAYAAPWRPAAVLALMVGYAAGRNLRRWIEPSSLGVVGETPWMVASTLLLVLMTMGGWLRLRASAELYAEWSAQPAADTPPSRWLVVAVVGLAAAVLPAYVSLPSRPTPPPDGEAIGRAVAGSTGGFELVDGHLEAGSSRELSLVEEGLDRWWVATRDADGACYGVVFAGGVHERTDPIAGPCTGEQAQRVLG